MLLALPPSAIVVQPWMQVALGEIGVREDTRLAKSTPRIEAYHASTRGGIAPDDLSWCSSFINWVFLQVAIEGTRSKTASSWYTWGDPVDPKNPKALKFGCVVLMAKSDPDAGGSGHVGLNMGATGKSFFLIAGNQSQRVDIGLREQINIVATRMPTQAMIAGMCAALGLPAPALPVA